jgi:hypothetical protein
MESNPKPSAPTDEEPTQGGDGKEEELRQSFQALMNYSEKQQGYTAPSNDNNNRCIQCDTNIVGNEYSIAMNCSHKIHLKCSPKWTKQGELICFSCNPEESKKEEIKEEIDDEYNGFPVAYGTDPKVTAEIDKKYKIDQLKEEESKIKDKGLTQKDIARLLGVALYLKLRGPDELNFKILKDNNITVSDCINAKISLVTMYYHMGIDDVEQLKELGLRKRHLKSDEFDIRWLYHLFHMNYNSLKEHFGLSLKDAIEYCVGHPEIMVLIGLNGTGLMINGFSKKTFMETHKSFSKKGWIHVIGLKKKHMIQLQLNNFFFREVLHWSILDLVTEMKLNSKDLVDLQIDLSDSFKKKSRK